MDQVHNKIQKKMEVLHVNDYSNTYLFDLFIPIDDLLIFRITEIIFIKSKVNELYNTV